jgi:predicted MFS family arabinose efflux permease
MFLIRLIVDTTNRLFIPFIPQFASGLGLEITAFGWLLALRSLTGLASPFIGILADRYGRRLIMIIALILRGIGLLGLGFSFGWWSAIPMLLISLTTTAYLPVQKAYVSDQVCYERRGRALAAVDASFSTAAIVGLPVVGWMIEAWGWQSPTYLFSALCFVSAVVIRLRLPKTQSRTPAISNQPKRWELFLQPRIVASVAVAALLLFVFILFMVFWALWLSQEFGFGPIEIGIMGTYIGIAEFTGLILAMLFIDQIGKRRGSLIGLLGSSALFIIIPFFQNKAIMLQILFVITALVLEFAVTAAIPLFAEQAPQARATVFSLVAFGNTIGIGLGPPVTTYLWMNVGVTAIYLVGAMSSILALLLVWKFLYDRPDLFSTAQV